MLYEGLYFLVVGSKTAMQLWLSQRGSQIKHGHFYIANEFIFIFDFLGLETHIEDGTLDKHLAKKFLDCANRVDKLPVVDTDRANFPYGYIDSIEKYIKNIPKSPDSSPRKRKEIMN